MPLVVHSSSQLRLSPAPCATAANSGWHAMAARRPLGASGDSYSPDAVNERAIVDQHLPDLDQEWRSTVERLVAVILGELPHAEHDRKWGRLTFTRDGDWHHWICAISPTKTAVKLMIHKGALLADPHEAMEGKGRYLRAVVFRAPDAINPDVVAPILREAAARQTEMLPSEPS
jgi:hypothetical protein